MREIKFKGKRVDNGEWVEGYHSKWKHFNGKCYKLVYVIEDATGCKQLIIPETLSEYTGLDDENEIEIFENDIVEFTNAPGLEDGIVEVYYDKERFRYCIKNDLTDIDEDLYCVTEPARVQKIGNIFDNPELLERN